VPRRRRARRRHAPRTWRRHARVQLSNHSGGPSTMPPSRTDQGLRARAAAPGRRSCRPRKPLATTGVRLRDVQSGASPQVRCRSPRRFIVARWLEGWEGLGSQPPPSSTRSHGTPLPQQRSRVPLLPGEIRNSTISGRDHSAIHEAGFGSCARPASNIRPPRGRPVRGLRSSPPTSPRRKARRTHAPERPLFTSAPTRPTRGGPSSIRRS